MPIAKCLTSPKLFEYLDEEVKSALIDHKLLSLFDYSWINEYDPAPEFIGLYKWSLDGLHGLFQAACDDNFYTQIQFESLSIICSRAFRVRSCNQTNVLLQDLTQLTL